MTVELARKPLIPYISKPLSFKVGNMIIVLGMIKRGGKRFAINLQQGNQSQEEPIDDVPLHINFRPLENNCVVFNSFQNKSWGCEERTHYCPIKIAIDGTHFHEYKHRVPFVQAKFLHIYQDADVSIVTLQKNQGKDIKYPSPKKSCDVVPYISSLGFNGLHVGQKITIQGKTTLNAKEFTINLQQTKSVNPQNDGVTNIALHLGIRLSHGIIVRNNLKEGTWYEENRDGGCPIGCNEDYIINIFVRNTFFDIQINNKDFCKFTHRAPLTLSKFLYIKGDTTLQYVS